MREIELKPSRRLGMLLLGMTALAWAAIGLAALSAWSQLALGMAVAGLGAWGWRQASRAEVLRIAPNGQLQKRDDEEIWRDVELLGDSFVSTALIVLRYQAAGKKVRTLTLLPDSADADSLRRLRVSLRWARRTRSDTSFPGAG